MSKDRKLYFLTIIVFLAVNKYINSMDFQSSNNFYHQMTDKSKKVLTDTQMVNPVIDQLDPETFEVAAKKHSTMWNTQQYKDQEFRQELLQTTNRIA